MSQCCLFLLALGVLTYVGIKYTDISYIHAKIKARNILKFTMKWRRIQINMFIRFETKEAPGKIWNISK